MARRQVKIFIDGKAAENSIKGLTSAKRKLINELRNLNRETEDFEQKEKQLLGQIELVNDELDDYRKKIRRTSADAKSAFDKLLKSGVAKFAAVAASAFAVDQIVSYGTELFKLGSEMEVLGKKAETVFAEALPSVTRAAEENATAMGLTTSQYTDAATAIADLLIPMKFQREEAASMSTELVNLSGALSEWTGGQISAEEVSRILSKAILGEREELKQLGISISEADVKARLAEKGLKDLTGEMLQQAKAAATLELITEKSADAQAAFAENSETLVRKQAELAAKVEELREKMATALIPIFHRLIGVVNSAVDIFTDLSDPISSTTRAFDDQQEKVNTLERELPALLSRYDELTSKTELSAEEQEELGNVIKRVGELTPTAITEVNEYGEALSINANASREFLEAEKARLQFINKETISALENEINKLETLASVQKELAETGRSGGIISVQLGAEEIRNAQNQLAQYTTQLKGARAELARLRGDNIDTDQSGTPTTTNTGSDLEAAAEAEKTRKKAEAKAKEEAKADERELQQRMRQLERLQEVVDNFREKARLGQLEDDERRLEEIRILYQKQIDLITELEAQGIAQATELRRELIALQAAALQEERFAQDEAFSDALIAQIESDIDKQLDLENKKTALLVAAAEDRNIQLLDKEQDAADKTVEIKRKQHEAVAAVASAGATIIGSALDLLNQKELESAKSSKILTLIQIGLKSAAAIASAVAASAGEPFPANLVAIAGSIAAVTSGIAQARQVLARTPDVPQKKKGRWLSARGQDDGITYRAEYIGRPGTGYLPDHPVLLNSASGSPVLASEAGREYFVSNQALQNPVVLNHVQAIDNIQKYQQRRDGGFVGNNSGDSSNANTNSSAASPGAEELIMLTTAITQLNELLSGGIYALIDDDTIIDLRTRIAKLEQASGNNL